jgi:hypothetical protein
VTILPQLERDLFDAAREHLPAADAAVQGLDTSDQRDQHRPSRIAGRPRRQGLGATVSIALSIAVAVAVAAVALTALRHGHAPRSPTTAPSRSTSRRELIQTLGILRTPQTKAERDVVVPYFLGGIPENLARRHRPLPNGLRQLQARWGYPNVDRTLIRAVDVPGGKLTIFPLTYQPSTRSPRRTEGLGLQLQVPGSPLEGLTPESVAALRSHGLNLFTYARHRNTGAVVVPDDVAKVTLGPFRVTSRVRVAAALTPTVSSVVHNNVAAFQLNAPTVTSRGGLPGQGAPGMYSTGAHARMTWFGARGNVISRTTIVIAFNFIVRATTRTAPTPKLARRSNAIIKDCLANGQLTHSYTTNQLRQALAVMPAATKKYTNCSNVISRALLRR